MSSSHALLRRFLLPPPAVSLLYFFRFGALVSPRAEIDYSPWVVLGRKTRIGSFSKIKASDGPLRIGARVDIATGCFITSHSQGIAIGDDTLIGPHVCIICSHYRFDRLDQTFREQGAASDKGVTIGCNVMIGAGACLLEGADIGDGVIVAPHSVVTSRIPANTIVKGDPARVVFQRRDQGRRRPADAGVNLGGVT